MDPTERWQRTRKHFEEALDLPADRPRPARQGFAGDSAAVEIPAPTAAALRALAADEKVSEFVVLLSGSAELRFEDESEPRRLSAGDWLIIPAGRRHRVEKTDADRDSVWLAVHYRDRAHLE